MRLKGWEGRPLKAVLVSAFVVLYLFTLLAGTAGVLAEVVVTHRLDKLAVQLEPLAQANAAVLQDLTDAETGLRGYQLTGQSAFLQPYNEGLAALPSSLQAARSLAHGDGLIEKLITKEAGAAGAWLARYAGPALAAHTHPDSPHVLALGKALFDNFRNANAAVADRVGSDVERDKAAAHQDERIVAAVLAALFVLTIGAGTLLGLRVVERVVPPLEGVLGALKAMTGGQGGVRIRSAGTWETRELARAVNALAEENERRARAQRQRSRLRELHLELMRNFNEHLDLARLVDQAVAVLGLTLEADRAVLRLAQPGVAHAEGATVGPATFGEIAAEWRAPGLDAVSHLGEPPAPLLSSLASFPADGGCHDASSAVASLAEAYPEVRDYVSRLGARSMLVCPLVLDGSPVGRVTLSSGRPPGTWSEETRALVEQAAADLARAVGHGRLYEEQRQLVAELTAADQAKTLWVGNVSHELRTPLTTVRGYVEVLLDGDAGRLPKDAVPMLEAIDRNALRLQGLIDNLLTLSKVGAGTFQVAHEAVVLAEVVGAVVADMAPVAARRGVALELNDEAPGAVVSADAEALGRALGNLVSNAVKFSPTGGRVSLAASVVGEEVAISVSDTGMGIPAADLARVGERFFRASNAQSAVVPGTGLGLSIVRAILDALGGHFSLASTEGAGTTATVTVPLHGRRVPLLGEPSPAYGPLALQGGFRAP